MVRLAIFFTHSVVYLFSIFLLQFACCKPNQSLTGDGLDGTTQCDHKTAMFSVTDPGVDQPTDDVSV